MESEQGGQQREDFLLRKAAVHEPSHPLRKGTYGGQGLAAERTESWPRVLSRVWGMMERFLLIPSLPSLDHDHMITLEVVGWIQITSGGPRCPQTRSRPPQRFPKDPKQATFGGSEARAVMVRPIGPLGQGLVPGD